MTAFPVKRPLLQMARIAVTDRMSAADVEAHARAYLEREGAVGVIVYAGLGMPPISNTTYRLGTGPR